MIQQDRAPDSTGWADLLPHQSLEFGAVATQYPTRAHQSFEPQGYVDHLSAGGWPDVTEQGVIRDASGERREVRRIDSRTALTVSPLADRDGYTGTIPAGSSMKLPPIAQPIMNPARGNVKGKGNGAGMLPKPKPKGPLRGWNPISWKAAGRG